MKHVTHLAAWDIRRVRVLLGIWIVMVVADTVVTGIRPLVAADPSLRESVTVAASLLWLTMALLTVAAVSFVIHGDPTVGSDAFWMTRPIRPSSLLVSKLFLVTAMVVVAPVIADVVLLIANKMPASVSAGVIGQSVLVRLILSVILMVGAALTRNLPRFALLCGAVLLAFVAFVGIFIAIEMAGIEEAPPASSGGREDDPTGLFVFNVLLVAAAVTALAVQYRTRLRRRSVVVGVAAITAATLVSSIWPVPFLLPHLVIPAWAHQTTALAVSVDPATISTNTRPPFFSERPEQWSTVNARVSISGIETGWTAEMAVREASLQLTNGVTLRSRATWRSSLVVAGGGPMAWDTVVGELLGVIVVRQPMPEQSDPPPEALPALFLMRRQELSQHAPARGVYRARLDVTLTHHQIDGILPLRPGAAHQNGGYRFVIDRITQSGRDVAIVARESRATSMWERRPWSHYTFYLRNRARRQAVAATGYEPQGDFSLWRFLPVSGWSTGTSPAGGFYTRGLVHSVPRRYGRRAEALAIDEAWLAGADLVIVRQTQEGSVERTLEIPDFPVGNAARAMNLR